MQDATPTRRKQSLVERFYRWTVTAIGASSRKGHFAPSLSASAPAETPDDYQLRRSRAALATFLVAATAMGARNKGRLRK